LVYKQYYFSDDIEAGLNSPAFILFFLISPDAKSNLHEDPCICDN
jgi:hypothetical protein